MFAFSVLDKGKSKAGFHRLNPKFTPFGHESGPPSISEIAKAFLHHQKTQNFHFCCCPSTKTNCSLVACAIVMLRLGFSPKRALKTLGIQARTLEKYRDASSYIHCRGTISVLHCLEALALAIKRKLLPFSLDEFPVVAWKHWESPLNGDLNWIVGNKIIAFAAPLPENQAKITTFFRQNEVALVVRCSKETKYNAKALYGPKIKITDIYFADGDVPTVQQARQFIKEVEATLPKPVAVHCRAGLGRTGTLICCWLMQKEGFKARESVAYLRMMRPGSVSAYQEHWLLKTWAKSVENE